MQFPGNFLLTSTSWKVYVFESAKIRMRENPNPKCPIRMWENTGAFHAVLCCQFLLVKRCKLNVQKTFRRHPGVLVFKITNQKSAELFKNFPKFIGKHLCRNLFLIKLQALDPQINSEETAAEVFSCEFCEIFLNTFFTEHFRITCLWLQLCRWKSFGKWLQIMVESYRKLLRLQGS